MTLRPLYCWSSSGDGVDWLCIISSTVVGDDWCISRSMDARDQTTKYPLGTNADHQGNDLSSERQGSKSSNQQQPKWGSKCTNNHQPQHYLHWHIASWHHRLTKTSSTSITIETSRSTILLWDKRLTQLSLRNHNEQHLSWQQYLWNKHIITAWKNVMLYKILISLFAALNWTFSDPSRLGNKNSTHAYFMK